MHTPIPNRFIAWTKAFFKGGRPRRKRGMVWWQQPVTLMPMGKSGTREPSHWKVRSPLIVPMQYKFSDIFFYLRGTYVKYPGGWLQLKAFCCWLKGVLHTFITAIYEQKVFWIATTHHQLSETQMLHVHHSPPCSGFTRCLLPVHSATCWRTWRLPAKENLSFQTQCPRHWHHFNRWNTLTLKFGEPLALPKFTIIYAATKSCAFQRSGRHYCQLVCMRSPRGDFFAKIYWPEVS